MTDRGVVAMGAGVADAGCVHGSGVRVRPGQQVASWNENGHRVILPSSDSKKENGDDRRQQCDA